MPRLTAAENALPLELDGVPVPKARAAWMVALEALGVAGRAGAAGYSLGGSRQRSPGSPLSKACRESRRSPMCGHAGAAGHRPQGYRQVMSFEFFQVDTVNT